MPFAGDPAWPSGGLVAKPEKPPFSHTRFAVVFQNSALLPPRGVVAWKLLDLAKSNATLPAVCHSVLIPL